MATRPSELLHHLTVSGSLRILPSLHANHHFEQDIHFAALSPDLCAAHLPNARQILDTFPNPIRHLDVHCGHVLLLARQFLLGQNPSRWEMYRYLPILHGLCGAERLHGSCHTYPANACGLGVAATQKTAARPRRNFLARRNVSDKVPTSSSLPLTNCAGAA